jgi:N-methylhydantoinase A
MRMIGVDTGGTFTDTIAVLEDGRLGAGKALTTHGALADGVMASLARAAAALGLTRPELLAACDLLSHGTTVGLNALLTGSGAKVGLLTTEGFESTLPIARSNKVHGLPEEEITDARRWRKPDLLVPRRRILGVRERIDAAGEVVVPLDEAQARAQIRRLVDDGVEAIAAALLWSPVNGAHEARLAELVAEEAPGLPVTLSGVVAPRIGEYERTVTAVMNAYIAPVVTSYLDSLEAALRAEGFRGLFLIMTMGGGVRQASALRSAPVHLLQSGPVGGVTAARRLGETRGHERVIATDVGGTSFDVGLIVEGALPRASRPRLDRHAVAVPVIDLASIGTGGGSIAWLDETLGAMRVGPMSAGSAPGPACYGRGGERPTVTDAAVVLGYLDRLAGSLALDRDAAARALSPLAERLGLSLEAAAEGVLQVANAQMADLIRRATIQRGHDPRRFVLYAYGGAAPQYVGRYAEDLGVQAVVIPRLAPEFSAWGAVSSDLRALSEVELPPQPCRAPLPEFEAALERLEAAARRELKGVGAALGGGVSVERRLGLRFQNQIHRIDAPLPAGPLDAAALGQAEAAFRRLYERMIGKGSSAETSPVEALAAVVEARMAVPAAAPPPAAAKAAARPRRARRAWLDGGWREVPVFAWDDLAAGATVEGPTFVESEETTAVLYPGQQATADAAGNLVLQLAHSPRAEAAA